MDDMKVLQRVVNDIKPLKCDLSVRLHKDRKLAGMKCLSPCVLRRKLVMSSIL